MNLLPKSIIKQISSIINLLSGNSDGFPQIKNTQNIILTYHGVSVEPHLNCVDISRFIRQLEYLEEHFKIVKLEQLIEEIMKNGHSSQRNIAITFDDAYKNFLELAYPELVKRKIPATVFVPAGLIGQYNKWDYPLKKRYDKLEIMTEEELKSLDTSLIELGSHGIAHVNFSHLGVTELEREIFESKKILEEKLTRQIRYIAFPYGTFDVFDTNVLNLVKKAGYSGACTTVFGRKNSMNDIFSLYRISIWDDDDVHDLDLKLNGSFDWLYHKEKLFFKIKNMLSVFQTV